MKCPNCSEQVENHPQNGCVLAALVEILRDRGRYTDQTLQTIHANCDVDALWEDLGPVIDRLGDGDYSQ